MPKLQLRFHEDKLIKRADPKKTWGREDRVRRDRVDDGQVAFALPPEGDKPRWLVCAQDSTKRLIRFVVKVRMEEDEATGEAYAVKAYLSNPLEVHLRDQAYPEGGWLSINDPALVGVNLDETLGEHPSRRWDPTNKQPRWAKKWLPDADGCTSIMAERLVVSASTENEARLAFMGALNLNDVSGYRNAFKVQPYDEESGKAFPITMLDRKGRPLEDQVPPKSAPQPPEPPAASRKGAKKPGKKAS